jgi:hypothetical protein
MSGPLLRGEPATLTGARASAVAPSAHRPLFLAASDTKPLQAAHGVSSITGADDIQETRVPIVAGRAGASLASNPVRTVELFGEHVLPKL